MKRTKAAVFILASILLVGCGKSNNANSTNAATSVNTTASPKATVEPVKSPGGTTVQTKVSSPQAAADGLLNAWKTKDEAEAAKFATVAAFTKLFKEGGGPSGMESQGCSEEGNTHDCAYTYPGGSVHMYVKGSESAGYKVDSIEFVAD